MKTFSLALGMLGASLAPSIAMAELNFGTWEVTSAVMNFTFRSPYEFVDVNGHYGQAGRTLTLSSLNAELDTSQGSYLNLTDDLTLPEHQYDLDIHYRFRYTVRDALTHDVVAEEHAHALWKDSGLGNDDGAIFRSYGGVTTTNFGIFESLRNEDWFIYYIQDVDLSNTESSSFNYGTMLTFPEGGGFTLRTRPEFGAAAGVVDFAASVQVTPVPEPETYAMIATGLAAACAARRFKAKGKTK